MSDEIKTKGTLIGEGKMAKVYLCDGFAYKCFRKDYPRDWIEYEKSVQDKICKTDLPVVHYYDSEYPNSIKMDYIDGVTLVDRMRAKYPDGITDMISNFPQIHRIKGLDLPRLKSYVADEINKLADSDALIKENALSLLDELPDGDCLCHCDYHFLNLMYSREKYYIIDWISAKCGNPLFDCARTYVIAYEFAYRLSPKVRKGLINLYDFDEGEFDKAVYTMAVHRLTEYDDRKVRELISGITL